MDSPFDIDAMVCPTCGSEYQLHVTHCIDCGSPTHPGWAFTDLQREELARRASSFSPESENSVAVWCGELHWAKRFGRFLEEHGIRWRLEASEISGADKKWISVSVCVAEEDLERAMELEQEHLLLEVPDSEPIDLPSIDQCPACGSLVSPKSVECQSCGLALGEPISDGADMEAE